MQLRALTAAPSAASKAAPCRLVARAAAEDVKSAATNMLDFEELSDVVRMVQETDIVELELKSKRFSLSVRKKEALKAAEPTVIMQAAPHQQYAPAPQQAYAPAPAPPAPAPAAPAAAAAPPPAPVAAPVDGVEVTSPMSGTLYRSPAPGEPPFVKEGDRVKKGQTVCIVEAMKLMNEIECDADGVVVKLLVDNGGAVVPGTPLMLIKP